MHLHQVHHLHAQAAERGLHLRDAVLAAAGPHLGGEEEAIAHAELGDEVAGDRFRAPVHGRGVDDVAVEELEDLAQRLARRALGADVEGLPGAQTDFGQTHFVLREYAVCIERQARGEESTSARVHEMMIA